MKRFRDHNHSLSRVLVTQLGARRHYAVPMAFEQEGMLETFCTDILIQSRSVQNLIRGAGGLINSAALRRLADRQVGGKLPAHRIRTFPMFGLRYKWNGARATTAQARTANWMWGGKRFAESCATQIQDSTSAVYAFTSAACELFQEGKRKGAACWLDHGTAPRAFEVGLIQEEAQRFPGWSSRSVDDPLTDAFLARQREELGLADTIVCGSSFAKRAIEAEGIDNRKIAVVPLGIADHLYTGPSRPDVNQNRELRVLYVGGDGLRKGIGYLSQAVKRLGSRKINTVAAGNLEMSERALAELSQSITLLGAVPRSEMPKLFAWADVLVLPSICDTFGMVILEAMAAGLPVISTVNTAAPDIIREGRDGYVVPIRDADAIADRLEKLASDRTLLRSMAEQAQDRAKDFTVARYGSRLISGLGLA